MNTFTCGAGPGSGGTYDINFWKGSCEKIADNRYRCTVSNAENVPPFTFAIKNGLPYINDKLLEEATE